MLFVLHAGKNVTIQAAMRRCDVLQNDKSAFFSGVLRGFSGDKSALQACLPRESSLQLLKVVAEVLRLAAPASF